METRKSIFLLAVAFVFGFVLAACILWTGSYQSWNSELGHKWLIFPLLAGTTIFWILAFRTSIILTPSVLSFVFPVAVIGRAVVDDIREPMPWVHSLLGIEVIIASVLGMVTAYSAAAIAWLLLKLTHRRRPMV